MSKQYCQDLYVFRIRVSSDMPALGANCFIITIAIYKVQRRYGSPTGDREQQKSISS